MWDLVGFVLMQNFLSNIFITFYGVHLKILKFKICFKKYAKRKMNKKKKIYIHTLCKIKWEQKIIKNANLFTIFYIR